jgi:hypothetical protein
VIGRGRVLVHASLTLTITMRSSSPFVSTHTSSLDAGRSQACAGIKNPTTPISDAQTSVNRMTRPVRFVVEMYTGRRKAEGALAVDPNKALGCSARYDDRWRASLKHARHNNSR